MVHAVLGTGWGYGREVEISLEERRRRRLATRHLLTPADRVETVDEVADELVALHSSDPVSVYLSAALRLREPSIEAVDRALYDDRRLLRHHAMRRTLWAMPPDTTIAAHAGFTRKIAAAERRRTAKLFGLDDAGVDDAVERVSVAVHDHGGPIGTRAIGEILPDLAEPVPINQGTDSSGRMPIHPRALLVAAFEGRIARGRPAGTWIASQYDWWPVESWVGRRLEDEHDELDGATTVIGAWLATSGPATLDDLVWWSGSTKTLVRRVLERLDAVEIATTDGRGEIVAFVLPGDGAATDDTGPWVALLPGLDPTSMGWKQRTWYLDEETNARVTDRNGNIGPTVWADGRVVGGWAQRSDGTIAHDVDLRQLGAEHRDLLDVEIERLRTLVGDTRFTPRFPSPTQKHLLA